MRVDDVVARTTWEPWEPANPLVTITGMANQGANGTYEVIVDEEQMAIEKQFLDLMNGDLIHNEKPLDSATLHRFVEHLEEL